MLLDAGLDVVRRRGLAATTIDELCEAADVTKGAFFHHFTSKEQYAIALAEHWTATTSAMFAAAPYHEHTDPLERVLAYADLRTELVDGPAEAYSCVVGTMTQEAFATQPAVRDACAASMFGHAATLEADLQAALDAAGDQARDIDAASLARFTQAVVQGSIILGKASADPAYAREAIEHLRRYLTLVLDPSTRRSATVKEET